MPLPVSSRCLPLQPIYSYILFEPDTKIIVDIREKVAISRHANTGAYAFPCGECLRNACRELLDNPVGKAGEFYTSTIIEGMITAGEKVSGVDPTLGLARSVGVSTRFT